MMFRLCRTGWLIHPFSASLLAKFKVTGDFDAFDESEVQGISKRSSWPSSNAVDADQLIKIQIFEFQITLKRSFVCVYLLSYTDYADYTD